MEESLRKRRKEFLQRAEAWHALLEYNAHGCCIWAVLLFGTALFTVLYLIFR